MSMFIIIHPSINKLPITNFRPETKTMNIAFFHQPPCSSVSSPHNKPQTILQPNSSSSFTTPRVQSVRAHHGSSNEDSKLELEKKKNQACDLKSSENSKSEEKKMVEVLESLEEEVIMGDDDQGREPTDYNRRARIFDTCSRVFQDLKHT